MGKKARVGLAIIKNNTKGRTRHLNNLAKKATKKK